MIDQLLAVLSAAGVTPTPRELRDALWLADHVIVTREPVRVPSSAPLPSTPSSPPEEGALTSSAPTASSSSSSGTEEPPSTELYAAGGGSSASVQATAARSPAVPALRHKADLIRALRPLRRRSPSPTMFVVDEDATAARAAAEGLWLPVLRPAPARWLELTLVIDTAPSMVVWRRTIAELLALAERLGAFRRVRMFGLDGSGVRRLTVVPNLAEDAPGLDPATLVDPSRRQAILVVTDGVGAAWRDGRVQPVLRLWANAGPVAVTTVLPQRMWAGTGLHVIARQVRAPRPGAANTEWITSDPPVDVPVPVLNLSARWLAPWAQLVAGAGDWRHTALLAEPAPSPGGRPRDGAARSAKDIVRSFRKAASPTAFRLACYLSAAWLNLPVMRLVQQVMLPESDLAHLAEVFLGGLLHRISDDPQADPDTVQYEFLPGVRDELNGYLLRDELLTVLQRSSEFVAERFGQPFDFAALLADPAGAALPAVGGETGGRPLAHVAVGVLANLGGRYRALAERLTPGTVPAAPVGEAQLGEVDPSRLAADTGAGEEPFAVRESVTADLEIALRWNRDNETFDVALSFRMTTGEVVDIAQVSTEPLRIDTDELQLLTADEPAYGDALTRMLFGPADVREYYMRARASTEGASHILRVRLVVSGPARYQALRWESLRDPSTGAPIATLPNVLWSRYLTSPDWRPVPALAGLDSALIVIAAPRDLRSYRPRERDLVDVHLEEEFARARAALAHLPRVRRLEGATLANMMKALGEGVDILYLVCHGALMKEDVPVLYLENPDRTADPVDGRLLVERLSDLAQRPAMVMLCSAQSASAGTESWSADSGALSVLAPRIAAAGVAAVVAMQGNISMWTAATFTPAFFTALAKRGIVDEAMAVARRAVRERPDWWVPVLFSRLRSGRISSTSGFAVRREETWKALASHIKTGNFTPVIGPQLASGILGSRQDIARRWAARWQMPLPVHAQDDLAQVAQYLSTRTTRGRVRAELQAYLMEEIRERQNRATPDDLFWNLPDALVQGDDLTLTIREVGKRLRARDNGDPYRILAELNASLYLTTDWTDLLQDALMENGRKPITTTFRWNDTREVTARHVEPPTPDRPLIYHLCGRLHDPDSLVLSEDDYFEWLNAWATRRRSVPPSVLKALTNTPLLFLGYRSLDNWDFRIISQGIRNLGGSALMHQNLHVAALPLSQDLEEAQNLAPDWVSIYWGETRRFLNEMRERIVT
jgi:hypothetical protein